MGLVLALSMLTLTPTASFSKECSSPDEVIQAFGSIAEQGGAHLEIVQQKDFPDGSGVVVFWAKGETVLVVFFENGCATGDTEELTLGAFRDITGISLS